MSQHEGPRQDGRQGTAAVNKSVIGSLASGSVSSAITTTVYQPLELLKTQIQLGNRPEELKLSVIGRATRSAKFLIEKHNLGYLWRGTRASLVRSVPGVGLYYTSLNLLQTKFSNQHNRPDTSLQAFYFGLASRSFVSLILLPVTTIKVRYESGLVNYSSLSSALKEAYFKNGWVGVSPTILRDSLFSGIYYMCYTELRARRLPANDGHLTGREHVKNFENGLVSGFIASMVTNPLDVVKTNIQAETKRKLTMKEVTRTLMGSEKGFMRFFDGLAPRSLRRTLIAATTWTFYEILSDAIKFS